MSQLRQSVAEWCYFKGQYDPVEYYRRLKAIGFSAVEMVEPARRPLARAAGLEILNLVGPGMRKGLNRREHHAEILPAIRQSIAEAATQGIAQVIIFSGNREGLDDDTGLRHCIEAGKALARDAERSGVTLTLELLNSFGHKDYQADRGAFVFAFARAVASPAVKVLYDIFHAERMGEQALPDILANLDILAHLHVAASPDRDFPSPEKPPDYGAIVRQAHAAGYRGCWGHEYQPTGDALEELSRGFALFESYVVG